MRTKRQRPSTLNLLTRKVKNLLRSSIGRKWGNHVTLEISKETKRITLKFRTTATNLVNRAREALIRFAESQQGVRYSRSTDVVSLA